MLQYWIICIQNIVYKTKNYHQLVDRFELPTGRTGVDVLQTVLPTGMVFEAFPLL